MLRKLNLSKNYSAKITLILLGLSIFLQLQFDFLYKIKLLDSGTNVSNKFSDFVTTFLVIIVEAFPFLVFGTLVSIGVDLFVKEEWIVNNLPKNKILSHFYISMAGMFMPVCECGNVPVSRRLMLGGFKVSHAVTFLLAAPILNPITLFSTWKAFSPDMEFLILRALGGLIIANIVGILISFKQDQKEFLTKSFSEACEHHHHNHDKNKLEHASNIFLDEFISVAKMLTIGAILAALFQIFIPRNVIADVGSNIIFSVLSMMLLAFVISICSNVDAFVILPYKATFTTGSILSFLVFGPMIDIKILTMLKSTFRLNFLILITFLVALQSLFFGLIINYFF